MTYPFVVGILVLANFVPTGYVIYFYNSPSNTTFDHNSVETAREGIYPIELIKKYSINYQDSGGQFSLSEYYSTGYKKAIIASHLKENIVFATHNLSTDEVFNEMQLILCRNVMIYFKKKLKNQVLDLFHKSLCRNGILCLGTKESLQFSSCEKEFDYFNKAERIYRKKMQ